MAGAQWVSLLLGQVITLSSDQCGLSHEAFSLFVCVRKPGGVFKAVCAGGSMCTCLQELK